jgi:cyclohexanone monooxygenase
MTNDQGSIDVDALRERYRLERDKRLRSDGVDQYVEARGEFGRFVEADPYAPVGGDREPVDEDVEVAIIGGGFSGLLAAARLTEQGLTSFRIVEAGTDFGGTWYWNRYPGAQCDTDAYCYLPLLEELGYMPREKYAYANEIFEHSQRIGRHYDLYDRAHFSTRVSAITWDDSLGRWRVTTDRGDDVRARFVVSALGPMSRPKLPGIAGMESFAGHSFHTARWDFAYTGGDTTGAMTGLADKTVAVIGTGASAIQSVPRLAADAKHVYVFQRTPSSVDYRRNRPTDPQWWSSLEPGWQRQRRENFNAISMGRPVEVDLVDDGWTDIFRSISSPKGENRPTSREERDRVVELSDMAKMEQIRGRVDESVSDTATAALLKPYYRVMCKRPTFNDEYLDCFNQPNVTLVDVSETKGVERITERGVVANGHTFEVDLIVYASGFENAGSLRRRTGIDVIGRNGVHYDDQASRGLKTLHGFCTRGFPNMFSIGVSQNAFSVNMTSMFDDQARHIAYIVAETIARGARTVEATEEGQNEWVAQLGSPKPSGSQGSDGSGGFLNSCTPGYYNNEGRSSGANMFLGAYPRGITAFNQLLEEWRDAGTMDGLELTGYH